MTECGCVPLEYGDGPDNTACRTHGQESERRERYAGAIYGPAAPYHMTPEGWATVDAAMDVADAEIQSAVDRMRVAWASEVDPLWEEGDRLREERDAAREQCTEMEQQHRFAEEEAQGRIEHLLATIASVGLWLEDACDGTGADLNTLVRILEGG